MARNILVVEDSESQAEKLRLILEINKYDCLVATSGEEAVKLLGGFVTFDLVISDVIMPGMTGYELCQFIKNNPATVNLPVLLITSTTSRDQILECIQSGADAFLTKPYEPEVLVSRLKILLSEQDAEDSDEPLSTRKLRLLGKEVMDEASLVQLTNLLVTTLEDVSRTNAELDRNRNELKETQKKLVQYTNFIENELGSLQKQLRIRNEAIETLEHALLIVKFENQTHIISDANPAIEAVTGYKPKELVGKALPIFTANIESHVRIMELLDFTEDGKARSSKHETLQIVHKDGSRRWCDFRVSVITSLKDELTLFACSLSDITSEYSLHLATGFLSHRSVIRDNFYSDSVLEICRILNTEIAFISELRSGIVQPLTACEAGNLIENGAHALMNTDFLNAIGNESYLILDNAQAEFPDNDYFRERNIRSYMSTRIQNSAGTTIGHIGIMGTNRITRPDSFAKVLEIFAIATGSELEREKAYKQYEDLFQFAPDAMLIIDGQGTILLVNEQAEKLYGYPPGELAKKRVIDLFPAEQNARYRQWLSEYRAKPTMTSLGDTTVNLKGITCDGREFPIEMSLNPIKTESGKAVAITVRDISLRLQFEEDRLARLAAEEANVAKSAFLATMSHEIRTPINGVIGSAEILTRMPLGDEQTELVQTINESGLALLRVIDEILDFSKIEAGKLKVESEPVGLELICESVCRALAPIALKKGVKLSLFVDQELPHTIVSDSVRLRQILNNLISNALKFSGNVTGEGRVDVRIEARSSDQFSLSVSDNGIGMSEEYQRMLFTPFTQEHTSTTRRFGGTGLGLTICKRLIELLGGEISVDSAVDSGTTFTAFLPLMPAPTEPAHAPTADLHDLFCMLVFDDAAESTELALYLRAAGAEVQQFSHFDEVDDAKLSLQNLQTVVVSNATQADSLQWFTQLQIHQNASLLILQRTENRVPLRQIAPSVLLLEYSFLFRMKLLTSVAIAAGRASLPIAASDFQYDIGRAVKVPDRLTAIKQGQLILVTEDNLVNQTVIRRQLAMLGYLAEIVSNGQEGLKAWQSGDYALLLTDLHMPEMDGYELTRAIRALASDVSQRPIIALTANALKGEREVCLKEGMNDYLSKPISLNALQGKLEQWLPNKARTRPKSNRISRRQKSQAAQRVDSLAAQVLNLNDLKKLVGEDPAMLVQLCSEFSHTLASDRKHMQKMYSGGESATIRELAHRIKSSARMFGATAFAECCERIERQETSSNTGFSNTQWEEFDSLARQVLLELDTYK